MARHRVADAADLPEGEVCRVEVEGTPICLAHAQDGNFYALYDLCTHEEGWLSEGWLDGMEVECPVHNSLFDLRTGEAMAPPAMDPARTFPVTVEDSGVFIEVP